MFPEGSEGGMPDMAALLAQAQQMQDQLMATKAELESAQVTGSAANGLVSAVVTGTGDLVSIDIKPEAVDPEDTETLADMVVAALRDATDKANELAAERMGPLAGALGGAEDVLGGGAEDVLGGGAGGRGPDELPGGAGRGPAGFR